MYELVNNCARDCVGFGLQANVSKSVSHTLLQSTSFQMLLLLMILHLCTNSIVSIDLSIKNVYLTNKIELARKKLQNIIEIDNENSDPPCWQENTRKLIHEHCSSLNYTLRSNIALKLTICHIKLFGINVSSFNSVAQISSNDIAY